MAYTTIDDPSVYFQTTLYTGSGSSTQNVVNGGNSDLQPDLVWVKNRTDARWHRLVDSSRGVSKNLYSNEDDREGTETSVTAFNSDGFSLGTDTGSDGWNEDGDAHVAWQWKANGGTTASNSNGSITSTVQANTTAGFSIITYTANGTADATVGHGLSAAPQVYWCKARTYDSDVNWIAEWSAFTSGSPNLNLNRAPINYSGDSPLMTAQATTITHTTARAETNHTGTHVIYCWTPIQGYSKFGSYTGNGNADGPFVYTGFKPAWLMARRTDADNEFFIWDTKRNPFNVTNNELRAGTNDAESTTDKLDLLSNGFKIRNTYASGNADGGNYIYMAFAESPFVSSEGVPTTAR
jgi:hypothetical protein